MGRPLAALSVAWSACQQQRQWPPSQLIPLPAAGRWGPRRPATLMVMWSDLKWLATLR